MKIIIISMSAIALICVVLLGCKKNASCDYTDNTTSVSSCNFNDTLNMATGTDSTGVLILPGSGVKDPYWKLLNNPPLVACTNALTSTIDGSAYVINFLSSSSTGWVNQPSASTLSPIDLGTANSFGCNNSTNGSGQRVPYVFERPFCVNNNTKIDFSYTFRGDDEIYFELINNNTGTVIHTSPTYIFPAVTGTWTASNLAITAGSYSIRAYLTNISSVVLGCSFVGVLKTSAGDKSISNNSNGCCENNTISILAINESNCSGAFDAMDIVATGWMFLIKNSSGNTISTGTTDINGNLFVSGLSNGTYTIQIIPQMGWTSNNPLGGTSTVVMNGSDIKLVTFYNCK